MGYEAPWEGRPLRYRTGEPRLLAIDTETLVTPKGSVTVPPLALVSVSSGVDHALLYPHQLADFLTMHWDWELVGFNVAFDYWVMVEHLGPGSPAARVLTATVDQGRFHDLMLLDLLLRLARDGGESDGFASRNLGEVAEEYAGLKVAKDDPYRTRYGEIIGKDWAEIDPGFLDYAILDAYATRLAAVPMLRQAREMQEPWLQGGQTFDMFPDAARRFGVLSESLQVKAAVVLAQASRAGMAVSLDAVLEAEEHLRGRLQEQVAFIRAEYPQLLDEYKIKSKAGQLKVNKGTDVPKFKTKVLRGILDDLDKAHALKAPRTEKTKEVSASVKVWRDLYPSHPLIKAWSEMQDAGKLLQFIVNLKTRPEVHPSYRVLVRTGRTSASKGENAGGLNIQQMPREAWFRRLFVARPGMKLGIIDYSYIELRTLASVCMARYGWSKLADAIKAGVDPHVYTAAMFAGIKIDDFKALKATNPGYYESARQAAKAINFGVPGGLGATKLAAYAKASYGVEMTVGEAARYRERLIKEVYPELEVYLADTSDRDLARNMGVSVGALGAALRLGAGQDRGARMAAVRKIVGGRAWKADGTSYNPAYVAETWRALQRLYRGEDEWVREQLVRRLGSELLESRLFDATVATLTGRLRSRVAYTEARNTPFQALAADGAKEAMWLLYLRGFRIVAFVHDEIVIEAPASRAEELTREASELMCKGMSEVLYPGIPCATKWYVSDNWVKE